MNWYVKAQINTFRDRNIWNKKIIDLKEMTIALDKFSKLVFQTGRKTKELLQQIVGTKRLSSFPEIEGMIIEAGNACLDSPQRASVIMKAACEKIAKKVTLFEKDREDFASGKKIDNRKGWRSND